jgi:hypothetical protein
MQASREHEFFPGSCCACADEIPIAANPTNETTAMIAEIRSMKIPSPGIGDESAGGKNNSARRWRSQGESSSCFTV